jgi:hypothetical protein
VECDVGGAWDGGDRMRTGGRRGGVGRVGMVVGARGRGACVGRAYSKVDGITTGYID